MNKIELTYKRNSTNKFDFKAIQTLKSDLWKNLFSKRRREPSAYG
ncbi:hypothetical protein L963_1463 [Leuconostoc mesenteroides subsp. cremoris T26]|nr:hypothetical protein L963_1463 [Leuconostoc mesenteroides subsp. cremoris T26]